MNEISIIDFLFRQVNSNNVMFDVGAMNGSSATPFLHKGWTVHSFEPDHSKFPYLEKLKHDYQSHFNFVPCAVSDEDLNEQPFFRSDQSAGISSLLKFTDSHVRGGSVPVISLKAYCAKNNISDISFLKIDVEGLDYKVLKGFPWETIHPQLVMCEYEDKKMKTLNTNWRDIAEFLYKLGYNVLISEWKPIIKYGEQYEWYRFHEYPTSNINSDGWGNIIAWCPESFSFSNWLNALQNATSCSYQKNMNMILRSKSWRFTKPLRIIYDLLTTQ